MEITRDVIERAINRKEIYRYLGYGMNEPEPCVLALVDEALLSLLTEVKPKSIYKIYDCRTDKERVFVGGMEFKSRNLAENLAQCNSAAILAATLGIEADKLLQRCEVVNMAKASVLQACAAACIEAYCNLIHEEIRIAAQKQSRQTLYLRPRFSAGYGDLPLAAQKDIFRALDCTKRIGLTLTQNLFMYPSKSVTAFIGLTENSQNCHIEKCKSCQKTDCAFRV